MISGIIPRAVGNLLNLEWLQMNDNYLSGTLPEGIGNLQNLTYLYLSDNDLQGVIPSSLQNLTNLNMLSLDGNNFQGHIPSQLGSLQSLQWLGISNNNLNGSIFLEVPSLIYLNLSNNYLTGVVPMEVGDLKQLNYLDFSGNLLHGAIPSSLGNCSPLTMLMMQDNLFQGLIPQSLSSLRGIEVLDLSKNNLSGEIPKFLGDFLSLRLLNLSYNNFEGMLPTGGIFKNVTGTIVIGNNKLCGGIPEFHLPMCPTVNSKGKGVAQELTLSISIISGLIGVALLVFLYLYVSKKKKKAGPISTDNQWNNLSYGTLFKATDGFSPSHLIGVGSFGSVYKGIVHESGALVAVKVLNLMYRGAMKSFISECEALKHIKHRNLLKVLTVCSGIDYKGVEFKALVYEFMVNGSLEEWLHPNQVSADVSDGSPKILTIAERMNISIHVASALDYLHNHCHNPVIHCDLKPSNVLLDADMVGHVGDFGLAKIILESDSNAGAELSSAGIRGTVGYAPPEYGVESVVSREGDVYSYGILLLEVFTGVTPVNEMFEDNSNLHNFVKEALPERVLEITDPILLQEREIFRDPTRENIVRECLVMVYELGIACSVEVPRERMSIVDVTTRLCSIKDRLYAAGLRG